MHVIHLFIINTSILHHDFRNDKETGRIQKTFDFQFFVFTFLSVIFQ